MRQWREEILNSIIMYFVVIYHSVAKMLGSLLFSHCLIFILLFLYFFVVAEEDAENEP